MKLKKAKIKLPRQKKESASAVWLESLEPAKRLIPNEKLAVQAKTDQFAMHQLILQNLALIRMISTRSYLIRTNALPENEGLFTKEDFFQIGVIAMMKAVEKYNPDLPNSIAFAGWAAMYIRSFIGRFSSKEGLVAVPHHAQQKNRKDKFFKLGCILAPPQRLAPNKISSLVPIDPMQEVEDRISDEQDLKNVLNLLISLDEKDLDIIGQRLNNISLQNIGKKYGVTREGIRQRETRILIYLRNIASHQKWYNKYREELGYSLQRQNHRDFVIKQFRAEFRRQRRENKLNQYSKTLVNIAYRSILSGKTFTEAAGLIGVSCRILSALFKKYQIQLETPNPEIC